jgi:UDP-GlcNAc:undecaprenyl-phosphate GlcNAc-1-phosphate transferase
VAANIIKQLFIALFLLLWTFPFVKSYYFSSGLRWQYIFIFSLVTAYFFTPFCRLVALRLHVLDKPDWRKVHDLPTPLLGGLGIYMAFTLSLLLFYHASWAPFINIPLTVLWIVGLTNAMNFFDGIDGLATGMSIIVAFFLGIIAFKTQQPALGWFAVAMVGACVGFIPYNFRFRKSALLFLGDAGSTFLGFTLAGLAVLSRLINRQASNFLELLTCVNHDHLHHRLLFMGFGRKEAMFIISIMSTSLGVSAIIIMDQKLMEGLLGLFQAILIFGLIVALMLKGREKIPKEGDRRTLSRRREDREIR